MKNAPLRDSNALGFDGCGHQFHATDVRNATCAARRSHDGRSQRDARSATVTRRTSAARRSREGSPQRDVHAADVRSATLTRRTSATRRAQRDVRTTDVRSATPAARRPSQRDVHAKDVRGATFAARRSRRDARSAALAERWRRGSKNGNFRKFALFGQNSSPAIFESSILCRAEPDLDL